MALLEATTRDLTQRLYGTKSEKSAGPDDAAEFSPSRPRPRGQQPGSKGHGRSERSALLVVPEMHDLSPAQVLSGLWEALHRFLVPKNPPSLKCRSRPICDASNGAVITRRADVRRSQAS